MVSNPHEVLARHAKAMAFAHHLYRHFITSTEVHLITPEQWREVAEVITQVARQQNPGAHAMHPPSAATIAEIESLLRSMERFPKMTAEECFRRCGA